MIVVQEAEDPFLRLLTICLAFDGLHFKLSTVGSVSRFVAGVWLETITTFEYYGLFYSFIEEFA